MTLAAAPDALQGAVAAGILGCGSVILGASETAGRLFDDVDVQMQGGRHRSTTQRSPWCAHGEQQKRAIAGYGHPLHKSRDPRVDRLFEVARAQWRGPALRRDRGGDRTVDPPGARTEARAERVGGHTRGAARDRIPARGAARRADPRADRGADRASVRGNRHSRSGSRCRTTPSATRTTTASCRPASRCGTSERPRITHGASPPAQTRGGVTKPKLSIRRSIVVAGVAWRLQPVRRTRRGAIRWRADPHRQHARADRAAVGHRAGAQAGRRDLRGAAQQARRPAGPARSSGW